VTIPNRAAKTEQTTLASQLGLAVTTLTRMLAHGVPQSGFRTISTATPSAASKLNTSGGLLSDAWVRALLGLILGALLGVAATWLLDGLDRTIRTTERAEDVFGLPVIVEIPSPASPNLSAIPVVDVVVDPYSPIAEAYRKLHVAILTAPPVTWVRRGPLGDEQVELVPAGAGAPPSAVPTAVPPSDGGTAGTAVTDPSVPSASGDRGPAPDLPSTRLPSVAITKTNGRSPFSILVTSPDDEPTRSLVVVNLAAVFAEAGDRVLVATTGGMRTEFEKSGNTRLLGVPQPKPDVANLVANARPSQIPGVTSLALGQLLSNPSQLVNNARALVDAAHEVVDVLLLEASLLTTQDGAALLPEVDLVLVVCEAWRTEIVEAVRSQRLLAQRRPPVLGVVMTNMPPEPDRFTSWR
jgi:Mrp family chromosome partitioning ATPase